MSTEYLKCKLKTQTICINEVIWKGPEYLGREARSTLEEKHGVLGKRSTEYLGREALTSIYSGDGIRMISAVRMVPPVDALGYC